MAIRRLRRSMNGTFDDWKEYARIILDNTTARIRGVVTTIEMIIGKRAQQYCCEETQTTQRPKSGYKMS